MAISGSVQVQERLEHLDGVLVDVLGAVLGGADLVLEAGHGPQFRRLEALHPDMDRAQAFLEGAAWALGEPDQRPLSPESGSESGPGPDSGS